MVVTQHNKELTLLLRSVMSGEGWDVVVWTDVPKFLKCEINGDEEYKFHSDLKISCLASWIWKYR